MVGLKPILQRGPTPFRRTEDRPQYGSSNLAI